MSVKNKLREMRRLVEKLQEEAEQADLLPMGPNIFRVLEDGSWEIVRKGRNAPGYEDGAIFLPEIDVNTPGWDGEPHPLNSV